MPAPATTEHLLTLIRKSELIDAPRLDSFVTHVSKAGSARNPQELVAQLIAAGMVTHFQAEQLLLGKWRGFTIGKYKVLERLGSGGMGHVYLCEHLQMRRRVAVKVLPTSQAHNPSALGRFYREARASGVLDHPNLVKAHDIDQDGGLHFLVMDYVDGASLQNIVSRFGPMPIIRAAHCIRQAAEGLQHAYESGLLHRDVKPANIMLDRTGTIRVLDLGLARFYQDDTDLLTLKYDDRNVLGTADFVSPEQALNSHDVDIRTDIYSLGATFYFLLVGHPPFPTGKIAQKLIWHQVRQPTPIRQIRPEIPVGLATIIEKMMAKDPAHRQQTPAEVVETLQPWTAMPMAPPSEEEMPRLSPAVAPTAQINPGAQTPRRGLTHQSTPAPGGLPAACLEQGSSPVATLAREPSAGALATPRVLSSAESPTATEQSRPTAPVEASKSVKGKADPQDVPWYLSARAWSAMRTVLLALAGSLVGVAVMRLLTGR
jgi:serine/threonine protein kinase